MNAKSILSCVAPALALLLACGDDDGGSGTDSTGMSTSTTASTSSTASTGTSTSTSTSANTTSTATGSTEDSSGATSLDQDTDGSSGSDSASESSGSSGSSGSGAGLETGGSSGDLPSCPEEETSSGTDTDGDDLIEIAGCYVDNYGSVQIISDDAWVTDGAVRVISTFDNDLDFAVMQNPSDDPFNPDLWARNEWLIDGDEIYYCTIAFGEATEADALAAGPADASNVDTGCNGFSWTRLAP